MIKKKILLADDDELMRNLYKDILHSEFEVVTAQDGEDALLKIKSSSYDLIIMDMLMPKKNGLEVITSAFGHHVHKQAMHVVFLTNLDGAELKELKKLGYPYIIKSEYTPEQFMLKVKSLIK